MLVTQLSDASDNIAGDHLSSMFTAAPKGDGIDAVRPVCCTVDAQRTPAALNAGPAHFQLLVKLQLTYHVV
jgi:hypothetical protein